MNCEDNETAVHYGTHSQII